MLEQQKLMSDNDYNLKITEYITSIEVQKKNNSVSLAETYQNFGYFLFENREYEMALLMLRSSYNMGYNKEIILQFINDSFISPNSDEFKTAFEANLSLCSNQLLYLENPGFEELPIDFIPYDEDKYFIFDNISKEFNGIIDLTEKGREISKRETQLNDEFSDLIINEKWNITKIEEYINSTKGRLIYYIAEEPYKALSFLKIPKIERYINNLIFVESIENLQLFFHENTEVYLPRLYYSSDTNKINEIVEMINNEHSYRLTPAGRNTSNVILTIGIPSYNRGHRAFMNIKHLLNSIYDSEIEFVVSNNCSIENADGYDEIEKLEDSRINYYKFPDKPGENLNFAQVIHIANGQYTCLLSDEDYIYLPNIHHYLAILKNNKNISCAKAASDKFYTNNSGLIYQKGDNSFLRSFLNTNYISGLIFKTQLFHDLNLYEWTNQLKLENSAAMSYYHSWWISYCTIYGEYLEDNILFITEGNPELEDTRFVNISESIKPINVYSFSTIEKRLDQHFAFTELLNQMSKYISTESFFEAYKRICYQTVFLVSLVKNQYLESGTDWNTACDKIYSSLLEGISKLNLFVGKDTYNELVYCIDIFIRNIK